MVLAPLGAGVLTAALFPRVARLLKPFCAPAGIVSTSLLVAGGAAAAYGVSSWRAHVGVICMPLVAAALALALAKTSGLRGAAPRTVAIETLVKSPTLAAVLAREHLGTNAAAVPAAGMIWLAVVGAVVAYGWGRVPLPEDSKF